MYQSKAAYTLVLLSSQLTMMKLKIMYMVKRASTKTSIGQSTGIMLNGNSRSIKAVGKVGSKSQTSLLSLPMYNKNSDDVTTVTQYETVRRNETHRMAE